MRQWYVCLLIIGLSFFPGERLAAEINHEKTYQTLKTAVHAKKEQLSRVCNGYKRKAKELAHDTKMQRFFQLKKTYYGRLQSEPVPEEYAAVINELKRKIQTYFLEKYSLFYDMLMIDTNGDIFFTIRKESDYHRNIFKGSLAQTNLSKTLKKKSTKRFVDFQYFMPSKEPAAFFVEPFYKEDVLQGWFVLQCAINRINSLFIDNENLGRTGEVFLVNKEHFMMTNSRFRNDVQTMKVSLDPRNIRTKFELRKGRKEVVDYRRVRAHSYFEVFDFLGVEWLIVAKKDEDEILTEKYIQNEKKYAERLFRRSFYPAVRQHRRPDVSGSRKVDMDEFVRTEEGELLYTYGITTCTGFIASFPNRFSYMAHLSPYDKMYQADHYYTDLVTQILKRLSEYEICEIEKRDLRFYIVATHRETVRTIIDKMTAHGYLV